MVSLLSCRARPLGMNGSPRQGGYGALFTQLCEEGVLSEPEGKLRRFTKDYVFSSPSAAGAIVAGYNVNGRATWKVEGTGLTYGEWQDQQVSAVAANLEKT